MTQTIHRPLLVTGAHRSGTSWIGKMLAAVGNFTYANEPLSVSHRSGVLGVDVKHWYAYIIEENEAQYLSAFQDLIRLRYKFFKELSSLRSRKDVLRMGRDFFNFSYGRLHGNSVLLKDPFAAFSTPWFADRLNCQVVISIRHPAAFASSLKRLNWPFQIHDLLEQPLLMRDYLEQDRAALESVQPDDIIGQASWLWKVLYCAIHQTLQTRSDLIAVRHEDLSRDPVAGFRDLYQKLGFEFTPQVEHVVLNSSSSENPTELSKKKVHSVKLDSRANLDNWKKRLTVEEIARIRKITEDVSNLYYSDAEWD
ncbi:MAG TPA: sulfotransferase [Anaerolineales bacterium]|nr:sulfotransferase [Anaerolineales bacterium]